MAALVRPPATGSLRHGLTGSRVPSGAAPAGPGRPRRHGREPPAGGSGPVAAPGRPGGSTSTQANLYLRQRPRAISDAELVTVGVRVPAPDSESPAGHGPRAGTYFT